MQELLAHTALIFQKEYPVVDREDKKLRFEIDIFLNRETFGLFFIIAKCSLLRCFLR